MNLQTVSPESHEFSDTQPPESVSFLHEIVSRDGKDKLLRDIQNKAEQEYADVAAHLHQIDLISNEITKANRHEDFEEFKKLFAERSKLAKEGEENFGSKAIREFKDLEYMLENNNSPSRVELKGEYAKALLESILDSAPNKGHTDRTMLFVDQNRLDKLSSDAADISIEIGGTGKVLIPRGMFVSASSFDSWRGRPAHILRIAPKL